MNTQKQSSIGKKGSTIVYTVENFRYDANEEKIKWDAFRVYAPGASLADEQGNQYYNIPAGEVSVTRDPELDLEIVIKLTPEGVENFEVYVEISADGIKYLDFQERLAIETSDQEALMAAILVPTDPAMALSCTLVEIIEEEP